MILEVALLDVLPDRTDEFEKAFAEASEDYILRAGLPLPRTAALRREA